MSKFDVKVTKNVPVDSGFLCPVLENDASYDEKQSCRGCIINGFVYDKVQQYQGDERSEINQVAHLVGCLGELKCFQPEPEGNSHLKEATVDRCRHPPEAQRLVEGAHGCHQDDHIG